MKIRTDFVTNSSTTAFMIIDSGELSKADLFELAGVQSSSPLAPVFDALFDLLEEKATPISEYPEFNPSGGDKGLYVFIRSLFSERAAEKALKASREGKRILLGRLSSDNNEVETFFCCDCFELENDRVYFNALNCVW